MKKGRVTFLPPNKKVTKEIGVGEALIASQNAPSPKNPSRELKSEMKPHNQGENVPIFALPSMFFCFSDRVRDGRFSRLWRAGARHSVPLKSASFRPFRAEPRKGHHTPKQQSAVRLGTVLDLLKISKFLNISLTNLGNMI